MDCLALDALPLPLEVPEPTPCFDNGDFWELEGRAAQRLADPRVRPSPARRAEVIVEIEAEARGRFCGGCPIVDACLDWGQRHHYTGIAGGRWLVDGATREAFCKKNHSLAMHGYIDYRGFQMCRQCKRERDQRHRNGKKAKAA